jgi:hypothetical protein
MIVLSPTELSILRSFSDGSTAKGWTSVELDTLASRGLLIREERVGALYDHREFMPPVQEMKARRAQRAASAHFTISKRGRRALAKPFVSSF